MSSTLKLDILVDEVVMERFRDVEEGETKGEPRPNYCGSIAAAEGVAMRMLFAYDDRCACVFTGHLINTAAAFHRQRVQQGIETPERLQVTIVNCVLDPVALCVAALQTLGVEQYKIREACAEWQAHKAATRARKRVAGALVLDPPADMMIVDEELSQKQVDAIPAKPLRLVQDEEPKP